MTTAFNIVIAVGMLMSSLPRSNQMPTTGPALTLYVEDQDGDAVAPEPTPRAESPRAEASPPSTDSKSLSIADLRIVVGEIVGNLIQTQRSVTPLRLATPPEATVTLRNCFEWLQPRMDWSRKTETDYLRVVTYWETYHNGPGPDVRAIQDGDFATFAVATKMTRDCYGSYFDTLLRGQTRMSKRVPYGKPASDVVLTDVPYRGEVQRPRERGIVAENSRPLDEKSVSVLMENWPDDWPRGSQLLTPRDVGQTVLGIFWYFGLRKCDGWLITEENFDLEYGVLAYRDQKVGTVGAVPLPGVMIPPLWLAAKDAKLCGRKTLFPVKPTNVDCSTDSGVYLRAKAAYDAAKIKPVRSGGQNKWFHGFRASCSSKWWSIAPQFRERMTLHAAKTVVDRSYSLVTDDMRDAVERYPVPAALKALSDRIRSEHADCPR